MLLEWREVWRSYHDMSSANEYSYQPVSGSVGWCMHANHMKRGSSNLKYKKTKKKRKRKQTYQSSGQTRLNKNHSFRLQETAVVRNNQICSQDVDFGASQSPFGWSIESNDDDGGTEDQDRLRWERKGEVVAHGSGEKTPLEVDIMLLK